MLSLFRKSKTLAGLDLGSASVKLLQLGKSGDRYIVEAFAEIPLPEDAIVEKEIKDVAGLTAAIIEAIDTAKPAASALALAMPTSLVITKLIQMESSLKPRELEGQIQLDANRYIPYPLEEVSMDFHIVGPNEKEENKLDILIAAARKEQMEARVDAITDGGLPVRVVDVECYAIERVMPLIADKLPTGGIGKYVAVLNIGASVTSLTVLQDLNIIYTREEAFGGKQLTESIRGHFDLNYEQAEHGKRYGGLPAEYMGDVLEPFKESIAMQVSRALQFFYSASEDSIDAIVLTGGVANIAELRELIEQENKVPTIVANPFENMIFSSKVNREAILSNAPGLVVACGLALRSVEK